MDRYRIEPGTKVDLGRRDPGDRSVFSGSKDEGKDEVLRLNRRLEELQELLYAEGKHRLLVVLQGMDAAGKDGTIRHVFDGVNPQGVRVAGFKVPSSLELSHDYLWRVHSKTPARGEIVIFNRSHYEDVLIVRVLGLVPREVWSRRYAHIRDFEQMLVDEGTHILKFFLHIDRDEQKERFQARLDEPHKRWKFNSGDLDHRARWKEFEKAYEAAIGETSTESAPWYVIPANRKWYRNLVISRILVDRLERLEMRYPDPEDDLEGIVIDG